MNKHSSNYTVSAVPLPAGLLCVPAARGSTGLSASQLIAQQVFGDAGGAVAIITGSAIPQILVPGQILGPVRATISFVAMAALIVGSVVAGWTAEFTGLCPVMYAGAIGLAVARGLLALSPIWAVNATDAPIVVGLESLRTLTCPAFQPEVASPSR
jgi:hypothetical protein